MPSTNDLPVAVLRNVKRSSALPMRRTRTSDRNVRAQSSRGPVVRQVCRPLQRQCREGCAATNVGCVDIDGFERDASVFFILVRQSSRTVNEGTHEQNNPCPMHRHAGAGGRRQRRGKSRCQTDRSGTARGSSRAGAGAAGASDGFQVYACGATPMVPALPGHCWLRKRSCSTAPAGKSAATTPARPGKRSTAAKSAAVKARADAPDGKAIPWLLLAATSNAGSGACARGQHPAPEHDGRHQPAAADPRSGTCRIAGPGAVHRDLLLLPRRIRSGHRRLSGALRAT